MEYNSLKFTRHAAEQMFSRNISIANVKEVLKKGTIINSYPDDQPYPSYLLLRYIKQRPIHVVAALDSGIGTCIVITAYEPSLDIWRDGFKERK